MLTTEQRNDMEMEESMLEDAELRQQRAQHNMNTYYNAIKTLSDSFGTFSDEKKVEVAKFMQDLTQKYRQAERERNSAEDSYWQHAEKINQYKTLDAQQQPQVQNRRGRRAPELDNDTLRLQEYLRAGYTIGDDGLVYTPSGILVNQNGYNLNSNGAFVPAVEEITVEPTPINNAVFDQLNEQKKIKPVTQYQYNPQVPQYTNTNFNSFAGVTPQSAKNAAGNYGWNSDLATQARRDLKNQGYILGYGRAVKPGAGYSGIYNIGFPYGS